MTQKKRSAQESTKRSPSNTQRSLRQMIARRDGYRCRYCGVPTAATIEHMLPLSKGGRSSADNLCLACPYCNGHKGELSSEEFLEEKGWQIEERDNLPETVRDMLLQDYQLEGDTVLTGSKHAQLVIEDDIVILLVRPSKHQPWQRLRLGRQDHPRVVAASYDFLLRHYTSKAR